MILKVKSTTRDDCLAKSVKIIPQISKVSQ